MTLFSSRIILILSAVNFLLLVGGGLWLALYDVDQLPGDQTASQELFLDDMSARQQRSPVQLASLGQRPLFHQSRKQYIVKKAMPAKKQMPRQETPLTAYQLKGIVYIKGGNSFAVLLNKKSGKNHKLKVADTLEGWTVKSILKASAKFERDGEIIDLNLIKPAKSNRQ